MNSKFDLTFFSAVIITLCINLSTTTDLPQCQRRRPSVADMVIDEVLNDAIRQIQDPMTIPDLEHGSFTFFTPSIKLTKGQLFGSHSIQRCNHTAATVDVGTAVFHLYPSLQVERIIVNYDFHASYLTFSPTGTLKGTFNDIVAEIAVVIYEEQHKVHVKNIDVLNLEQPTVKLHTDNILYPDWLLNLFGNLWLNHYKSDIIQYVEGKVQEYLKGRNFTFDDDALDSVKEQRKATH